MGNIIFIYRFLIMQASACLFGIALIFGIIVSHMLWQESWLIARYDALFVYAVLLQSVLLATKQETLPELRVIFMFHIIGTVMELFKTHVGSWHYPEMNVIRIAGVPLFSGFMYSAVGSYIARCWRLYECRFEHYPQTWLTASLAGAIYGNFFSHHYVVDMRYLLFAGIIILYLKTRVTFWVADRETSLPLLLPFAMLAVLLWLAENIATAANIWLYPHQLQQWQMVSVHKIGSWFMLMLLSFVLVSFIHKPQQSMLADGGRMG